MTRALLEVVVGSYADVEMLSYDSSNGFFCSYVDATGESIRWKPTLSGNR